MSKVFRFSFLAVVTAVIGFPFMAEAQEPYRLDSQERLRVHVHEWPALTGEFVVNATGTLNLPLIGSVPAKGLSTAELASDISKRLQEKAKLGEPPEAIVDITQYRPFYILGNVERPGVYDYRPDMLVLNAVAIAGGHYRMGWATERDVIAARGQSLNAVAQLDQLKAREVRVRAELNGDETFPATEPSASARVAQIFEQERNLFKSRLEQHRNNHHALGESLNFLRGEIESLEGQIVAAKKQEVSIKKELDDTRSLVERSLAPAPRILPIERTLAQFEREQKEIATAIMRARQQMTTISMQRQTLIDERRSGALTELQTLEGQRKELEQQVATAANVLESSSSQEIADVESEPKYTIIRNRNGTPTEISAKETTSLQPGDILKVIRAHQPAPSGKTADGARSENKTTTVVQTP